MVNVKNLNHIGSDYYYFYYYYYYYYHSPTTSPTIAPVSARYHRQLGNKIGTTTISTIIINNNNTNTVRCSM
jgi:hypothetical protein